MTTKFFTWLSRAEFILRFRSARTGLILLGIVFGLSIAPAIAGERGKTCSARLPDGHLTARVKGYDIDLGIFSIFVLPEESVRIEPSKKALVSSDIGTVVEQSDGTWDWTGPSDPGIGRIEIRAGSEVLVVQVFVLWPASAVRQGAIEGYRIDDYPKNPYRGLDVYLPPHGFIRLDEAAAEVKLTPMFSVGQFVSKQKSGWPKFLVLREELLLKLHTIAAILDRAGINSCGIVIMSGFRTPYYNRLIGNGRYSRHTYGGAADVFIDINPRDGRMDDLNGDGRVNKADAAVLYDLIDEQIGARGRDRFKGGLGEYGSNAAHGPFIHIDARGYRARWGR